ncbi:anthranilate synthase component II [Thalassospira mesophila]|uniref:Anthranilate synthase n=1 Tax=Thalassospira mesophila TaxID=1293891 RepID=A0A1Y2KZ11_9PROT|nr:aminodeoxychorismate/anthranilate synthase component II [Thalassospira mesophila]OSQ37927.1 anthranilate synthase [Thalassospira mesophila]
MYLLIDNYDSFTFNLWHFLRELGPEVKVVRNDEITVADALAMQPEGIVISPGPCDPQQAGICVDLIKQAAGTIKLLGVCLGHQAIGAAFGGDVIRAPQCMHGKTDGMIHTGTSVFKGLPSPVIATRYHSLVVDRATLPDCLEITAESADGLIMGMRHREYEIHGVQFHPESIASEHGHELLKNFIDFSAA